jgi:hypothetical protein
MLTKLYFLGEFGYIFRQLLPFLEQSDERFEILTWEPVCTIINLMWPFKYVLHNEKEFVSDPKDILRDMVLYKDKDVVKKIEDAGYKSPFYFNKPQKIFFGYDCHSLYGIFKRKIMYGEQQKEKKYVSVFPRKRAIREDKNNITQEHIEWLKLNYPGKEIVGHGLDGERMDLGIRYCNDIYEQINVFNNSEIFICPSSGLADLALLCGCNLMLTGEYIGIEKTNTQGCKIQYWNGDCNGN